MKKALLGSLMFFVIATGTMVLLNLTDLAVVTAEAQDMPTPSRFPWEQVDPSIEEIYSAQEDLWLISSLLMAVREVNSGTVSVIDSHVKELQLVQLFRGTRLAAGASGASGGGAGGGAGGAMGGAGGGGPMGGGGGGGGSNPPPGNPSGVSAGVGGGGGGVNGVDGREGRRFLPPGGRGGGRYDGR